MMEDPMLSENPSETDLALQPLLEAAQESATSNANFATCRSLVLKVLSDGDIFAGYDQIRAALQGQLDKNKQDGGKALATLDLFSYGTYREYTSHPNRYLSLTDQQVFKLRQLTVLSAVQDACLAKRGDVSYQDLYQALQFDNAGDDAKEDEEEGRRRRRRAVEEVVLSCLYARVVSGQLCQKTGRLILGSASNGGGGAGGGQEHPPCRARDVHPVTGIEQMLRTVQRLQEQIQASFSETNQQQQAVKRELAAFGRFVQQAEERKKKAETSGGSPGGMGLGGGAGGALTAWDTAGDATMEDLSSPGGGAGGGGRGGHRSSAAARRPKRSRGGARGGGGGGGGGGEAFRFGLF